jgi:hypothetical protein
MTDKPQFEYELYVNGKLAIQSHDPATIEDWLKRRQGEDLPFIDRQFAEACIDAPELYVETFGRCGVAGEDLKPGDAIVFGADKKVYRASTDDKPDGRIATPPIREEPE